MNRRDEGAAVMPWHSSGRIRPVAPERLVAGNGLLSGDRAFVLADGQGAERLALVTSVGAPSGDVVALRLAQGVILIDASAAEKPEDRPDWRDHPDAGSRQMAWSLAAHPALALVGQIFGGAVDVVDIHADADAIQQASWLRISTVPSDETSESGAAASPALTLGLDDTLLTRLAGLPRRRAQTVLSQRLRRWSQLHGRMRVQVSGPVLTPHQLRDLERHDVIVIGQRSTIETAAARLLLDGAHGPALAWPIRLVDGGRAQVTGPGGAGHSRNPKENSVTNEAGNPPDGAGAPDGESAPLSNPVERLPVQVEFDLGRMDLPLLQLAQIEPGYVFQLPQALEQARVAIRLNGTLAGTGELVAIGDVLGVRLTAWTNGPDID